MLLDTHPAVVSIGELANSIAGIVASGKYREYTCSCGQPIRQCGFFREVQQHCGQDGVELDLHDFRINFGEGLGKISKKLWFGAPARHFWLQSARDKMMEMVPSYSRYVQQILHRTETIARAVLEVSGKQVLVDTSKGAARAFRMLDRSGLDFRLIHLVRDLRGVVHSYVKRESLTPAEVSRYWRRNQCAALELKRRLPPESYFCLRYEEFCYDPQGWLDRLCTFLGLEPAEIVSAVNDRPHHVIGNAMRLKPIPPIRSDESWREALSPKQLDVCERVAGDLNRRLGYS
jgi:hypothetical protein